MSLKRKILAVVFPPFAVVDKGCGIYLVAFILTCLGWIPGIIYAFAYFRWEQRHQGNNTRQVSKMQRKTTASNNSNTDNGNDASRQSPYNRPRRMSNNSQNINNNQSGGWQGW